MFGWLKGSNKNKKKSNLQFVDINGEELAEGDLVLSHRYELGKCRITQTEQGYIYKSIETGKEVNWALMIDAATDRQKVEKISQEN